MPERRRTGWARAALVALVLGACETAPASVAVTPAASPAPAHVAAAPTATPTAPAVPATATAADVTPTAPGDAMPPALRATVLQYRRDDLRRRLQVKIHNDGDLPVRIDEIRLDAPGFAALEPSHPAAELAPGRRVDLPLTYGEIRCHDGGTTAGDDVSVALVVRPAGGAPVVLRLPLPRVELLERFATSECDRRALAQVATVAFGTGWELDATGEDPVLRGTLGLRRQSGEDPLALTDVGSSVLLVIRPAGGTEPPLVILDPGATTAETPVEVTAPRCDAHAVSQSQRSFVLPVWVQVGGGEPIPTTIAVDDASQAQLDELLRASCGLGP